MSDTTRVALLAVLGSIVRKLLTIAGTAIVAHGLADQSVVDSSIPPIAEYIAGGIVILGSTYLGAASAWIHVHWGVPK